MPMNTFIYLDPWCPQDRLFLGALRMIRLIHILSTCFWYPNMMLQIQMVSSGSWVRDRVGVSSWWGFDVCCSCSWLMFMLVYVSVLWSGWCLEPCESLYLSYRAYFSALISNSVLFDDGVTILLFFALLMFGWYISLSCGWRFCNGHML